MHLRVINKSRQQELARWVYKADNLLTRLRGLLFSPPLQLSQGMLIVPCIAIHSMGMTYSIDAVFLDRNHIVISLVENFRPWQMSALYLRAHSCLELPAGVISNTGTKVGDQLIILESNNQ